MTEILYIRFRNLSFEGCIYFPMPFSIRDDDVKDLADELQRLTRGKNRTDTIRRALEAQIDIAKRSSPLHTRVELLQERARAVHAAGSA